MGPKGYRRSDERSLIARATLGDERVEQEVLDGFLHLVDGA